MTVKRLVLGVVLPLMVSGCVANYTITFERGEVTSVPFKTVAQGTASGIREPKFVVIRHEQEWKALWAAHTGPVTPPAPLPAVDFATEMIVAVFAGERPSGGQGIVVETIEAEKRRGTLVVVYRQTPPGAASSQALTQPFHMVKTETIEGAATFVRFARGGRVRQESP